MTLHALLWLSAALLFVLAGWQAWRLFRLGHEGSEDDGRDGVAGGPASAAPADERPPGARAPDEPVAVTDGAGARDVVTPAGELFAAQLEVHRLQRELGDRQQEVAAQRAEIARLGSELELLQQALATGRAEREAAPQAMSSPEYAEPLRLAEMGFRDEEIAARCDITLSEARLVLAMAQRGGQR